MRASGVGLVNLCLFGVFMLIAGVGTLVPPVVRDRVPEQIGPLWERVFAGRLGGALTGDDGAAAARLGESLALASQWVIGLTELLVGGLVMLAVVSRRARMPAARAGLMTALALFGTFMIVLFLLHDEDLPRWSKFPGVLAWIGVTWMLVERGGGVRDDGPR